MKKRFNGEELELRKEPLALVINPDDSILIEGRKFVTLKSAARLVGKSFKTVNSWILYGAKPGFIQTLVLFGTKFVLEDDVISYKALVRSYRRKKVSTLEGHKVV